MAEQLRHAGAMVTAAGSAAQAFAALDRTAFNVIVTDIAMPGTSGPALLRSLRERPRDQGGALPVIAVSGFVLAGTASAAGFATILQKPVGMQTFIAAWPAPEPSLSRPSEAGSRGSGAWSGVARRWIRAHPSPESMSSACGRLRSLRCCSLPSADSARWRRAPRRRSTMTSTSGTSVKARQRNAWRSGRSRDTTNKSSGIGPYLSAEIAPHSMRRAWSLQAGGTWRRRSAAHQDKKGAHNGHRRGTGNQHAERAVCNKGATALRLGSQGHAAICGHAGWARGRGSDTPWSPTRPVTRREHSQTRVPA